VRRYARAASGELSRRRIDFVRLTLGALLCLGALSLATSRPALGATVTQRPILFTIDGATVPDGPVYRGVKIAVDNATGAVYVNESEPLPGHSFSRIYRFHADGSPWPFSATGLGYLEGTSSAPLFQAGLAVDNSGGPNQGRLYVAYGSTLEAVAFSGERLWSRSNSAFGQVRDVAVDSSGNPYVVATQGGTRKYASSGSPPAEIGSIPGSGYLIEARGADEVFLGFGEGFNRTIDKWVSGSLSSVFDPVGHDLYVDQSSPTGPIFTINNGRNETQRLQVAAAAGQFRLSFDGAQTPDLPFDATEGQIEDALQALPTIGASNIRIENIGVQEWSVTFIGLLGEADVELLGCENGTNPLSGGAGCTVSPNEQGEPSDLQEYAAAGTLLDTYGVGMLTSAQSVAYDPGLDRVYVLQMHTAVLGPPSIVVLGPAQTGTVSDLTIDAPSGIGIGTAHFSGTVNPQGTNSEWKFQWRTGREPWTSAPFSPPQSLPADSSDHAVEYTTTALRGDRTYQVRLVAVNTANQLTGVSETETFTTNKAAQVPAVTIAAPSAVTADGVTISGTVNPQGDSADWRVQTSTDPACATGFTDQPLQSVPSSSAPVGVEYAVTGLLPSQHHCARILATNSAGSTTSEAKEFETLEAQPTQVFTAYAAPRTDTTARLNGYVNPEGSAATYRFEYSADGSTWTALPDLQTREAYRQIVVASELSGLQPATTYHYRFVVENDAGPVQSDEATFETRTTAAMQPPHRGIELVNKPEKGNQNIAPEYSNKHPFVSGDGNRTIWKLYAGAPGGNTGTEVNFLATRGESGWRSQPLSPPAAQQVGGGERAYKLILATPDLRTFLMRAVQAVALGEGPPTFVRIDDQGRQDILKEFAKESSSGYENADMTSDGAHVISPNIETEQLEEIGIEPHEIVSIMPDGQPAECGVKPDDFFGETGAGVASALWHYADYHRMATTDASRLYFEALPNGGSCTESSGHHVAIYYRDRTAGQTVEVDSGTATTTPPGLIRATPDGRSVLFATQTSHSPDDENTTGDVYRWDSESGAYTCLTCVVNEAAIGTGGGNNVFIKIIVSDDFSHVYFTSQKQLVPGHGMPGESSIYALSNGALSYVAPGNFSALTDSRVSNDGNILLFSSIHGRYSRLTADEQADECAVYLYGAKQPDCQVLFRYEDSTNSLECLSCLPGGVTTHDIGNPNEIALSKDGSTAAFVTHERLLPEDINNAEDIYGWRHGSLQLISDGETAYTSTGIGATPRVYGIDDDGENIFFTVVQPGLTGYEQDGLSNLYDARIGGGFPRPADTPHCSEESCQGPLAPSPPEQRTGSSSLNGAGNEAVARKKSRCATKRGKAKRRCVHATRRKHKKQPAKRDGSQRSDRGAK
jgi:hypothetical protein